MSGGSPPASSLRDDACGCKAPPLLRRVVPPLDVVVTGMPLGAYLEHLPIDMSNGDDVKATGVRVKAS